jgi:MFS family permease
MIKNRFVLPIIVIAQFCCTSLWFAGNAVMGSLAESFQLPNSAMGHLTSAVQFGFIIGTLVFAFFTIADRYSPSRVFFISALLGSIFNLGTIFSFNSFESLIILRLLTGVFLAGIYPVGMKIAADYFDKGLGKSLGFLVGALVVGTAFPHLIKGLTADFPWRLVLIITSSIAILGGFLVLLFVPDGPYRKRSLQPDFKAVFKVFKNQKFRSAALGYFGHMWELYAFWAFVPIILTNYLKLHPNIELNIPLWSFLIIGLGGLACVIGGYISLFLGTKNTAATALLLSGICCLISPLILGLNSVAILLSFLVFWGLVVVADSPLFSTLVAQNTRAKTKGTALTIVNSIGFAITIVSIQLLNTLQIVLNPSYIYMILAIGPMIGLIALFRQKSHKVRLVAP